MTIGGKFSSKWFNAMQKTLKLVLID